MQTISFLRSRPAHEKGRPPSFPFLPTGCCLDPRSERTFPARRTQPCLPVRAGQPSRCAPIPLLIIPLIIKEEKNILQYPHAASGITTHPVARIPIPHSELPRECHGPPACDGFIQPRKVVPSPITCRSRLHRVLRPRSQCACLPPKAIHKNMNERSNNALTFNTILGILQWEMFCGPSPHHQPNPILLRCHPSPPAASPVGYPRHLDFIPMPA